MKINYIIDTFNYFKQLHPGIDELHKTILDYGCNYGTFLDSGHSKLLSSVYTGIDVDLDAITDGKHMFPEATFIHSNQYNLVYNPKGEVNRPVLSHNYDTIISYSVLTHTTVEDFFATIQWLYDHLNDDGKLLVTYLNVEHGPTKNFFHQKRVRDFGSCDNISTSNFIYLIDNKTSIVAKECQFLLLFFNNLYLSNTLSSLGYNFTLHDNIPAAGCFQSCIVIDK